ncbi:hypothetical protein Ciccas_003007 [Cichlidogyrus casuarinus]|uniref:USP domain-containing protein n=1 Tax=Cichlidogyrus casuarinus TaxID=1844966 RepID=A0ABD2QFM0_9PLAT
MPTFSNLISAQLGEITSEDDGSLVQSKIDGSDNLEQQKPHDSASASKKSRRKKKKSNKPTQLQNQEINLPIDEINAIFSQFRLEYSSELKKISFRGIKNYGNCCYLSAILQCLFHYFPDFPDTSYFETKLNPLMIDDAIFGALNIASRVQEDASECFNNLLSLLHEESLVKADYCAVTNVSSDESDQSGWRVQDSKGRSQLNPRATAIGGAVIQQSKANFFEQFFSGSQAIQLKNQSQDFSKAIQEPFFILPLTLAKNSVGFTQFI